MARRSNQARLSILTRTRAAQALWGICALCLAVAGVFAAAGPVRAASNGSDWGPQGVTQSDSAVTVAWDNSGNPGADAVPRDASQIVPYTGGANYTQTNSTIGQAVESAFGGMKLTVSQTDNLEHQAVTLSYSGVGGGGAGTGLAGNYLDVFQCWGGTASVDGVAADEPDPEHCQVGRGGNDAPIRIGRQTAPADAGLISQGDLKAPTTVKLVGEQIGTSDQLVASVVAQTSDSGVATGASGTVEFDRTDGTVVAKGVPVHDGIAEAAVSGITPGQQTSFTASYTAAPGENYTSSQASSVLDLPRTWDPLGQPAGQPGSQDELDFAAGTFPDDAAITSELDGGSKVSLGMSDDFGGLQFTYTIPSDLASGTSHSLALFSPEQFAPTVTVDFQVTGPPGAPASGTGVNDPDTTNAIPYVTVDGTTDVGLTSFTASTANELADFEAPSQAGSIATRPFEMLTGAEAPGLGCGKRSDAASTSTCWLVAVPRGFAGDPGQSISSLSPSLWAQRVQVKLAFSDVATTCAGAQSRTLVGGSEILGNAMASWIPALCASREIQLGYTQLADDQARTEYSQGQEQAIFTSRPVDDSSGTTTLYAAVGLTGVTIEYHLWDSRTGEPVAGIKLNARLVVKLLTESYYFGTDSAGGSQITAKAPWAIKQIFNLTVDPEFRALNPDLPDIDSLGDEGDLVVTSSLSDASTLLWQWIVNDPDAKAFLDGCPDSASGGSVINPFYSARTYTECSSQASALDATAQQEIDETQSPGADAGFQYVKPSYPPTDVPFPEPGYYQRDPVTDGLAQTTALTLANLHPRLATLGDVGVDVAHYLEPDDDAWCLEQTNPSCTSGPGTSGEWVQGESSGRLTSTVLGLTDTSTAAQYQGTTAELCDDSGNCVGPNTASLTAAAAQFTAPANANAPQPSAVQDEKGGAYPLTLPVYAEVNTAGLAPADAKTLATVIGFITGPGQTPGFDPGNLPVGFAPITASEKAAAQAAVQKLDALAARHTAARATASGGGTGRAQSLPPQRRGFAGGSGAKPRAAAVPKAAEAVSARGGAGGAVSNPQALAAFGRTPSIAAWFPEFGLFTGLAGALVAGIAAPIVGRRRRGGAL